MSFVEVQRTYQDQNRFNDADITAIHSGQFQ